MGSRVDRRRVRTKGAVLDAAERLFAEHGYRGTSIEAIASEADVAVSSIYFNFEGGKSDIYLALALRVADLNVEYLSAAYDDSLDVFSQLVAVGDAYAKFHLENPMALRLLSLHDVDGSDDDRVKKATRQVRSRLRVMVDRQEKLVERALEEGGNEDVSAAAVTIFLWAAWNGALSMHTRGELNRRQLKEVLAAGQNLAIGAISSGNAAGLVGTR